MKRQWTAGLLFAGLTAASAPAFAVTDIIGDPDGFGIDPTGLVGANQAPADRDGDGILEPGDALPDLDGDYQVGPSDHFDTRSAAEAAATDGAEWTDRANSLGGAGAAHLANFTFSFNAPQPGDADYGLDHYVSVVYSDYDISPATMYVGDSATPIHFSDFSFFGASFEGLIHVGSVVIPWSELADGEVEVVLHASNETLLAFDYVFLSEGPWTDANGDAVPDELAAMPCYGQGGDSDDDGVCDDVDNCVDLPNADQADADGNGIGDACDVPADPCAELGGDADADGICGADDNCPDVANFDQADADNDGIGDVCDACHDPDGDDICANVDNCPDTPNSGQVDSDRDGIGDACDSCPRDRFNDMDGDGICGDVDNCVVTPNPDQADADGDRLGDACDSCPSDPANDRDFDGVCGDVDNCPDVFNSDQVDLDLDGIGDACDPCVDADFDTVCDHVDVCANTVMPEATVPSNSLNVGRYALLDGDDIFEVGTGGPSGGNAPSHAGPPSGNGPSTTVYTLADTAGCSCEQIIAAGGGSNTDAKFGCSSQTMSSWVATN